MTFKPYLSSLKQEVIYVRFLYRMKQIKIGSMDLVSINFWKKERYKLTNLSTKYDNLVVCVSVIRYVSNLDSCIV